MRLQLIYVHLFCLVLFLSTTASVAKPECRTEQKSAGQLWHNCVGKVSSKHGAYYEGSFRNGKLHGQGVLHSSSGVKYEGDFWESQLEGEGLFLLLAGTVAGEVSKDGDLEIITSLKFSEGANHYESRAIAFGMADIITDGLRSYLTDSHFIFGPRCSEGSVNCRQNLKYEVIFRAASVDLNGDGVDEVAAWYNAPGFCGSGGCTTFILEEYFPDHWHVIARLFPGGDVSVSSKKSDGYLDIYYYGGSERYSCVFKEPQYACGI